ncbi:MAG: hypothetical protein JJT76_09495 [Clostridiaceae bacterium]|nr:hypothetical protein [Clostridiaceae bacterium]
MPNTEFIAKVKKMDIVNKVTNDNWNQSITIILSDIELNDENLIAIRKFRPNEEISVSFKTLQLSMTDLHEEDATEDINAVEVDDEEEEALFEMDYDETPPDPKDIVKTFDFSKG